MINNVKFFKFIKKLKYTIFKTLKFTEKI